MYSTQPSSYGSVAPPSVSSHVVGRAVGADGAEVGVIVGLGDRLGLALPSLPMSTINRRRGDPARSPSSTTSFAAARASRRARAASAAASPLLSSVVSASSIASAPATCGVAMLVPLHATKPAASPATALVIATPGACKSTHAPKLENDARSSALSVAPIVSALVLAAGVESHASASSLPAATVTATPAAAAASTAATNASPVQPDNEQLPPRLSDATAYAAPPPSARAASSQSTTYSRPATMTDV